MNKPILPVLLSGGSGTRLWPLSSHQLPKQFLPINSDCPLIVETARRVKQCLPPMVICSEQHHYQCQQILDQYDIDTHKLMLEPRACNTLLPIILAALYYQPLDNLCLMFLPTDHQMQFNQPFSTSLQDAINHLSDQQILTLGIEPTYPATGYGYIEIESSASECAFYPIKRFIEKPDQPYANELFQQKHKIFWNSGIFVATANAILYHAQRYAPATLAQAQTIINQVERDQSIIQFHPSAFDQVENISFDYAIMEKTKDSVCLPADIAWRDLGTFYDIWQDAQRDKNNNVQLGDVKTQSVTDCYIDSRDHIKTVAVGVNELVIITTDEAVLVADIKQGQAIKSLAVEFQQQPPQKPYNHKSVIRPWGSYKTLAIADNYQVKEITITPQSAISLQYHHYRAEHWVVVEGIAEITRGNKVFTLKQNESTYIDIGEIHRIFNPGQSPLKIIETQSGSYLGEDDIVRLEDMYSREQQGQL